VSQPRSPRPPRCLAALALTVALAIWLPCLHLFFARDQSAAFRSEGIPPAAEALAQRQMALRGPDAPAVELATMHAMSGEWDFMARTYLAWSLAEMALRQPVRSAELLGRIDALIADTLRIERERGFAYFLLPYGRARPFVAQPARSLFVDGEIALALALRRLVAEREDYKPELEARERAIVERMSAGPVLSAESYPDECWTFCNAIALASLAVADAVDHGDHRDLMRRWVDVARAKLVDPATGLLVSRFRMNGDVMEGPEGSSIWMVAHALRVVDPDFARDQYDRARKQLGRTVLGFGYAREWSPLGPGRDDIDSGPTIPVVGANAGSSGLALVAAKSFGDRAWFGELVTTLDFAAFPARTADGPEGSTQLRYAASNVVGDAVLLYSMVLGPAWDRVEKGR